MALDLSRPRRVHLVGIGGAGMAAIAVVLHRMGHTVTGSDLKGGAIVERLRAEGITVVVGHDADNLGETELVAISTAIPDHNPEVVAAVARDLPVARRKDILPAIAQHRRTIVVAGTHGKTTTSSMLAMALVEAGVEPSFIIGGDVNEIGSGADWASGPWMVIEGDESDQTFLALGAEIAVITNVELDHLETYDNDPAKLHAAFVTFASNAQQAIYCADDPGAMAVAAQVPGLTYGLAEHADYRISDLVAERSSITFSVHHNGQQIVRVTLPTPGVHNARNAVGALVAALAAGADVDHVASGLGRFGGVARRFEFRGEVDGTVFVDDYAHLPTEVQTALAAAADGDWNRIICVFQPHRYSRTAALWQDFAGSFTNADITVITEIYASGEAPRPGITGELIVDAIRQAAPDADVRFMPRLDDVGAWLVEELGAGDLCLTLGAGDLTGLPDQIVAAMRSTDSHQGLGNE